MARYALDAYRVCSYSNRLLRSQHINIDVEGKKSSTFFYEKNTHIYTGLNKMTQLVMTLAETLHISEAVYAVTKRVTAFFENLERSRQINATINELSKLSDIELADIGISRGMIRSIAMESYK